MYMYTSLKRLCRDIQVPYYQTIGEQKCQFAQLYTCTGSIRLPALGVEVVKNLSVYALIVLTM